MAPTLQTFTLGFLCTPYMILIKKTKTKKKTKLAKNKTNNHISTGQAKYYLSVQFEEAKDAPKYVCDKMFRMPSITTVNRHALGRSFTLKRLAVICTCSIAQSPPFRLL